MTWILIIFMSSYGGSIDHIEFQHKASCEQAMSALAKQGDSSYLKMVCVPKNIKAGE
jgi:hypothetical protein